MDPPTLSETVCYELTDDFVDLYQGYTMKTTSQRKVQANKLMAKNVGRIHLAQHAPTGSPAAGSGSPEARGTEGRSGATMQAGALPAESELA